MEDGRHLAVLLTCHNRVQQTLRCLDRLHRVLDRFALLSFQVFLVDDGSSDGTSSLVASNFPDVRVVAGTGQLYWSGGMQLAFEASKADGRQPDDYLLLNDDVELYLERAARFIALWLELRSKGDERIVVGAADDGLGRTTYSGFKVNSSWRPLSVTKVELDGNQLASCDTFNANCVLLPGQWFRDHGGLDPIYTHGFGDVDLGLDARSEGVRISVFGEHVGQCRLGPTKKSILLSMSRTKRLKMLFGHPYGLRQELHFTRKHSPTALFPLQLFRGIIYRLFLVSRRQTVSSSRGN